MNQQLLTAGSPSGSSRAVPVKSSRGRVAGVGQYIDRMLGVVSPGWAAKRMEARASIQQLETLMGNSPGYNAGQLNRLTRGGLGGRRHENSIPRGQVERMSWQAWNLYRNNPHCRKICRQLESKVIGRMGPTPQPHAMKADGTPWMEFRERAKKLWGELQDTIDFRGRPGYGGQSLRGLARVALRSTILTGEVLYRPRATGMDDMRRLGLPIPLQLQLIHGERLAAGFSLPDAKVARGNRLLYGIELDKDDRRAAYWILSRSPNDPMLLSALNYAERFDASSIGHLYVEDDIDQFRGTSWFAPSIEQMRDAGDYEYNELKASAIAACPTLGIKRPSGTTGFGLQAPTPGSETDADGNRITYMQPGLIFDLGDDGHLEGFNPSRPNTNAAAWLEHIERSYGSGVPGIKPSSVTGNYERATFSSERACDNDVWPEIEGVQDWFYGGFYSPLYAAAITVAVEMGYFDGILSAAEFKARKWELLRCDWRGPVNKSVNPVVDNQAWQMAIACGAATPQQWAASLGCDLADNIRAIAEAVGIAKTHKLPETFQNALMGIQAKETIQAQAAAAAAGKKTADEKAGQSNVDTELDDDGGDDAGSDDAADRYLAEMFAERN